MAVMHINPQWWTSQNPNFLIELAGFITSRNRDWRSFDDASMAPSNYRLFGVACAHKVWHLLTSELQISLVTSEQYARGLATTTDLLAKGGRLVEIHPVFAHQYARRSAAFASGYCFARVAGDFGCYPGDAADYAARALACEATGPAPSQNPTNPLWHNTWTKTWTAARAEQADIFRDIIPPPGVNISIDPAWRTSVVVALASAMNESGDFSAVPLLADALQDAGCDEEYILRQCRSPGPHVRGNWVVEMLMPTV